MAEDDKYDQARRVLMILGLFQKHIVLKTSEILVMINDRFGGISKRSVQRDLEILKNEDLIVLEGRGRESKWKYNKSNKIKSSPLKISGDEMLSFYMLKAYLATFKGTSIENDIVKLTSKIENFAPGDVFLEDTLYWDQNPGSYDYSNNPGLITKLIHNINEKNWINISYRKILDDSIKNYEIFPCSLYTYGGVIYLVAYNLKAKMHVNFVIHNIIQIEESLNQNHKSPEFDYDEFRRQRFAVIDGEIKNVKLLINKDFVKYFEHRFWHSSQKQVVQNDGSLILPMKIPVTADLVTWICRWNDTMTVIEPPELRTWMIELLQSTLKNYEE
jgi:predicted DNA-binding transcriptional regulator YafY